MKILVTGGAGYLGSHTCLKLLNDGHEVIVVDNLQNSKKASLQAVEKLTNSKILFFDVDINNMIALQEVFNKCRPQAVIHLAALKSVNESITKPLLYYHNNVSGTLTLLKVMDQFECSNIVFSSSATVYGNPEYLPYDENHPLDPINPYGKSKFMVEHILRDWVINKTKKRATILRYFNPVGAHPSGAIGEDPSGTPANLMPFVSQVAVGRQSKVTIYGTDYDTIDGTGLRDYVHVMDLAAAHVCAVKKQQNLYPFQAINIGTGTGSTVLELIKTFERVTGLNISYEFGQRRDGDLGRCWADVSLAAECLDWRAEHNLETMCRDTWRWQTQNPYGYKPNNGTNK